jgi:predicted nuclease of predicted toxin-antitoxin system
MTVVRLRELGHDVKDIRGTRHQGLDDTYVWEIATTEQRILITTDKGFTGYRTSHHHGILVVRLRQPNRLKIHKAVMNAMEQFESPAWPGLLVVMRDRVMSTSRSPE